MQKTHSSGPARACDPTLDMAITGLMAALVFTGTYFFKIPTAFGYTHLGDCMIILTSACSAPAGECWPEPSEPGFPTSSPDTPPGSFLPLS